MALDLTKVTPTTRSVRTVPDAISAYAHALVVKNTGTVPVTLGGSRVTPGAADALVVAPGETVDATAVNRPDPVYAVAAEAGELTIHRVADFAAFRDFARDQVSKDTGVPHSLLVSNQGSPAAYEAELRSLADALNTWKAAA